MSDAVKLTADQRGLLRRLAAYPNSNEDWCHTKLYQGVMSEAIRTMPDGLLSKHYSSIGERDEKVHVAITDAGRAALAEALS